MASKQPIIPGFPLWIFSSGFSTQGKGDWHFKERVVGRGGRGGGVKEPDPPMWDANVNTRICTLGLGAV